jgi:hypothetical protein
LSAYSDGEVTRSEAVQVESHIGACEACASALREIQFTTVFLKTTREVDPPAYLTGAIMAAAAALKSQSASGRRTYRRPQLQWGFGAAALAGVLAALLFHVNQQDADTLIGSNNPSTKMVERAIAPPAPLNPVPQPEVDRRYAQTNQAVTPSIKAASAETRRHGASKPHFHNFPKPETVANAELLRLPPKPVVIANRPSGAPQPIVKMGDPMPMLQPETVPMPPIEVKPESSAPKIDMAVMSTPIPMETPLAAAEPSPPAVEPASRKITLTAEARALPAGQIASLADLKKTLKQQSQPWNRQDAARGLYGRQFSVGIVKRSF